MDFCKNNVAYLFKMLHQVSVKLIKPNKVNSGSFTTVTFFQENAMQEGEQQNGRFYYKWLHKSFLDKIFFLSLNLQLIPNTGQHVRSP